MGPEPKRFIHNRGVEYAARMPDIAEVPVPREAKKKKRAKKTDTPAAPIPQRSKAEVEAAIARARSVCGAERVWTRHARLDERNKKLKAEAKNNQGSKPVVAKAAKPVVAAKPAAAAKPRAAAKKPVKAVAAAKNSS